MKLISDHGRRNGEMAVYTIFIVLKLERSCTYFKLDRKNLTWKHKNAKHKEISQLSKY